MSKPRILHIAPANTSGVPGQFVQTERNMGFESRLVTLISDPRNYFQDICLNLPFIDFAPTRAIKKLVSNPNKLKIVNVAPKPENIPIVWKPHTSAERILVALRDNLWRRKIESVIQRYGLNNFDVFQLDGGLGLYRNASFVKQMHMAGKKIICCYTGSDLRTRGVIPQIDKISSTNVTVEFDHLQLHPNIHHVFFPFDSTTFSSLVARYEQTIRIGHAPTNRGAKGSDIIIPILKKLEKELNIEVVLIEGMQYERALKEKASCDIFVDQIGDLGYGINSLEALAMGIPTCSCLAPGFAELYPDHPFVIIDANNLQEQLERLIQDPNRRDIGVRGREWIVKNHDALSIVSKIHKLAEI
jgi:glycosyltransferase involved in cell wall biosynthesis